MDRKIATGDRLENLPVPQSSCQFLNRSKEDGTAARNSLRASSRPGSASTKRLEPHGGQAFESLVLRIDFDSDGFEGRYAQERLGVVLPENHRGADHFAHELDPRDAGIGPPAGKMPTASLDF